MSIKIGNVLHEADSEVVSLIHELHTDRERLQGRVALLENEAASVENYKRATRYRWKWDAVRALFAKQKVKF